MKSIIRFFALFVVVAGTAALALTPKSNMVVPSHLAATTGMPAPGCGPYIPGCH